MAKAEFFDAIMARKKVTQMVIAMNEQPRKGAPIHLALVDENEKLLAKLKQVFRGFSRDSVIETYNNTSEALAIIPRTKPDVVVMEAVMPKISGIECARGLKSVLPNVHIVMLTESDQSFHIVRALTAGAEAYLIKPVSPEACWNAVQEVINGQAFLSRDATQILVSSYHRKRQQNWSSEKGLTCREHEIMSCLVQGYRDKQIAKLLRIGVGTVHTHMGRMFKKLGVNSRAEAIRFYLSSEIEPA